MKTAERENEGENLEAGIAELDVGGGKSAPSSSSKAQHFQPDTRTNDREGDASMGDAITADGVVVAASSTSLKGAAPPTLPSNNDGSAIHGRAAERETQQQGKVASKQTNKRLLMEYRRIMNTPWGVT